MRELDAVIARRGKRYAVVSDYFTDSTSMATLHCSRDRQIDWHYISVRMPMQHGFIENFSGSFRDVCLHETVFTSLTEARMRMGE